MDTVRHTEGYSHTDVYSLTEQNTSDSASELLKYWYIQPDRRVQQERRRASQEDTVKYQDTAGQPASQPASQPDTAGQRHTARQKDTARRENTALAVYLKYW